MWARRGDVLDRRHVTTYITEETERLEQNLMGIDGENEGDNLEDDIPDVTSRTNDLHI